MSQSSSYVSRRQLLMKYTEALRPFLLLIFQFGSRTGASFPMCVRQVNSD
jgi:hypothetical protein